MIDQIESGHPVPKVLVENLFKTFTSGDSDVKALVDVSAGFHAGELVCIYGRSGSGKSTLLNALAGLVEVDSGSVVVCGVDVAGLNVAERARHRLAHTGLVFQDNNLVPELTAVANVELALRAQGVDKGLARSKALEALARLGVGGMEHRFPHQLSGGQQQRVGVARALVGERPILLADEPTGALDSHTAHALFEIFSGAAEAGTTVVVATHDPIAREYASRTLEMADGFLICDTTHVEQRRSPSALVGR